MRRVDLNIYKIGFDWLSKYKCHVINQSDMLSVRKARPQGATAKVFQDGLLKNNVISLI